MKCKRCNAEIGIPAITMRAVVKDKEYDNCSDLKTFHFCKKCAIEFEAFLEGATVNMEVEK